MPSLQTSTTNWEIPKIALTSDQLGMDSGIPTTTFRFDNSLERLNSLKLVILTAKFIIGKGYKLQATEGRETGQNVRRF